MSSWRCGLVAAVFMFVASAPGHGQQAASVAYDIYWTGLPVARVDIDFLVDEDSYSIDLAFRTVGIVAWIVDYHATVEASGYRGADGQFVARSYESVGQWEERRRRMALRFDADGRLAERIIELASFGSREPVPDALQVAPDPLSLALMALSGLDHEPGGPGSSRPMASYDGIRSAAITMSCAGSERLSLDDVASYNGSARRCEVWGEQTGGFYRGEHRRRVKTDGPVVVWLAPHDGIDFELPVRMELATNFGTIAVHLAGAGS